MAKRGRTSAANAAVRRFPSSRTALRSPADLAADEARLFRELVASCAPDHFVASDVPLLVSYVQATKFSRRAAEKLDKDASMLVVWERATKVQAMLATRLRLAPQARTDPKTLARRQSGFRPSAYDTMDFSDD